jgi:hypothetical protein
VKDFFGSVEAYKFTVFVRVNSVSIDIDVESIGKGTDRGEYKPISL